MGVLNKLTTQVRNWMLGDPATKAVYEGWAGGSTVAGVSVTDDKALNYSAVFAAVNVLSSAVASLPLDAYKRLDNGDREKDDKSDLQWILHEQPNEDMTPFAWKETVMVHLLLKGNAYCEIVRNEGGRVAALNIIDPDSIDPIRDKDGKLAYVYRRGSNDKVQLPASRVLHFAGLGYDGVRGYSVIAKAKESIGLGIATEKFGGTFFGNGSWPGLVAVHPDKMTPEAITRMKAGWEALHNGPDKAHKLAVLEGGMKLERITINPEDSQFLQTREFQVEEIARWFHLPPHKLGHKYAERPGGSIEAQNIEFVTDSLIPWLRRIEQELTRKLVPYRERPGKYVEFNVNALLRGDIESRFRAYETGRKSGWLSVNEIRRMENMNSIGPDGDEYGTPAPAPAPAAEPDEDDPAEDAPEEDVPQDEEQEPKRNIGLALASRAVAKSALSRMVRAEVNAVRKALEKGTPVADVYTRHQEKLAEVMAPALAVHDQIAGTTTDPAVFARDYVANSLRELDASADVQETLARWEQERADSVSDALFAQEVK